MIFQFKLTIFSSYMCSIENGQLLTSKWPTNDQPLTRESSKRKYLLIFWTYNEPVFEFARIDSVGVEDGSIPLQDANAPGASAMKVAHRMQTDITKALQAGQSQ